MERFIQHIKVSMVREAEPEVVVYNSNDVAYEFRRLWNQDIAYIESVYLLALNNANEVIGYKMIAMGGMDATIVDVRVVFQTLLGVGATSFIVAHNHPSGRIAPSEADIHITSELKQGGKILNIRLLDHIILSPKNKEYYSFADSSLL